MQTVVGPAVENRRKSDRLSSYDKANNSMLRRRSNEVNENMCDAAKSLSVLDRFGNKANFCGQKNEKF